jgi:hypothetical protein
MDAGPACDASQVNRYPLGTPSSAILGQSPCPSEKLTDELIANTVLAFVVANDAETPLSRSQNVVA